jgi:hypothetical protein
MRMRRLPRILWCRMAVVALAFPSLQTSCIEVAQRSLINGLFDAATPLANEHVGDCLTGMLEGCAEP